MRLPTLPMNPLRRVGKAARAGRDPLSRIDLRGRDLRLLRRLPGIGCTLPRDNAKPTLAASELSPEDAMALVGQSADSPEIAETPTGACNSPYCEEDDHGDDGSNPFHLCRC